MVDIVCYYVNQKYGYILFAVDFDGNQIWDAEFYPNQKILKQCWGVK